VWAQRATREAREADRWHQTIVTACQHGQCSPGAAVVLCVLAFVYELQKQPCSGYVLLLVVVIKGVPWLQKQLRVAQFISHRCAAKSADAQLSLQLCLGYSFIAGLLSRHCGLV
jgi:hypothetical protein